MKRLLTVGSLAAAVVLSACTTTSGAGLGGALSGALGTAADSAPTSKSSGQMGAAADMLKAVSVSDAELKGYSKQMVAYSDEKNPVAKPGSKYAARLDRLVKKHRNEEGMKLNFKVYMVREVNAFATPDGSIRVFAGLMDLMSDDELLSIIGHEIGHVKLGHSLKEMRTVYLASAGAKAVASQGGLGASVLAALGEKFVTAQFSQSQESESDAYGMSFLKRHKYNVAAAESAMRKIAKLEGASSGGSMFSSHPGSKERADKLQQLAASK